MAGVRVFGSNLRVWKAIYYFSAYRLCGVADKYCQFFTVTQRPSNENDKIIVILLLTELVLEYILKTRSRRRQVGRRRTTRKHIASGYALWITAAYSWTSVPGVRRLQLPQILWPCTSHAVLLMKTITVQSLLWFASLHQTGNDLQEDPTTRDSEPVNRIWDHWTSVLPTRGRRQPLENTGVRLWTRLRSRKVCHKERAN